MGEGQFTEHFNAFMAPHPDGRCRPFTDAVDRQYCRIGEGGGVKGAGGMREVVLRKKKRRLSVHGFASKGLQGIPQQIFHKELFFDPDRYSREETLKALRGKGVVCF